MGRRKLALKTLQNRNARRALFERRKKGLLKKASEISTLCGIDACVIIFPPPDSENPNKAETFPQDPTQVIRNIQQYDAKKNKNPEKQRKNYDLCEFFSDKKKQVEAETCRVREQRLKMTCPNPTSDDSFDNLGEDQLRMFIAVLDSKIQECDQTIGVLNAKKSEMPLVPMGLDSLDDNCLEMNAATVIPPHDVSDETYLDLGFMKNMSDEANVISAPIKRIFGDNNPDRMESYSLQAQILGCGPTWDDSFTNLGENQERIFIGSTLDSELQECSYQMIDMLKTKSSDDHRCMMKPVVPLQDISNQGKLSFLQNTTEDNDLVIGHMNPLFDNSLIDSYCLQDQALHYGLDNIDLDMLLGF